MKRLLFLLLFLPIGLTAFNIGPASFFMTNESLYQRNQAATRPDQFYQLLSLFSKWGKWSANVTLRGNNFYKQDTNLTFPQPKAGIYKAYVQFQGKNLGVTAGDFHAILGRGLVLSVLPNDKLLLERTITGGDLRWNLKRWTARLLGGWVRDDTRTREWAMAGSEAIVEYSRGQRLGLHASFIGDRSDNRVHDNRLTASVSASGGISAGWLTYHAEAGWLLKDSQIEPDGHAFFANVTYQRGTWLLMAEAKKYRDFFNEMNNPPTADREDEPGILLDSRAARLYVQYTLPNPDLYLFFNVGSVSEMGASGTHFYGGAAGQDLFGRLAISFSYGVRDIFFPVRRIDADAQYRLSASLSTELAFREKRYDSRDYRFCERDATIQFSQASRGSVHFRYQYSAERILERNHFFSGGARVYFGSAAYAEILLGAVRGGQVCAEGQCFNIPPFKGFRLSFFATLK